MTIRFTPLTHEDLVQLHLWLQRPHVARWWRDLETYEKVVADHVPALEGRDPTDHYLIVVDDRPIGMIQAYLVADHPEWEAILEVGPGVAGVDLFIGEEELIGHGLGVDVLRAFTRDVVFARPETHACVAGVEPENTRSLRAFEKAGFRFVRDYEEEGLPHRLLRLERTSL